MRKYLSLPAAFIIIVLSATNLFASAAGGIITNPNQSAEWVRTLNRYASTDVDAVFFNPAGTIKLEDGIHIGFSNQTFYKTYSTKDDSPLLPREKYNSYILSPVFPNLHVAYKKGKIAYMFGLDIMSGGGAGTHDDGIPFSDFIGVTVGRGDSVKSEFSGYFVGAGATIGAAYAVNDMLSFSAGLRYIFGIGGNSAKVTPYINGVAQSTEELDMTLEGNSYGFILGTNISPTEDLNIGLRYSYYSKWELEQEIKDGKDLYGVLASQDGEKVDKTMPQDIALGVSYYITPRWRAETSFTYYLNNATDWAEEKEKDSGADVDDGWEAGVALEYALLPNKLLTSIGYLYSKKGLPDELQTDLSAKIDAHSYGIGATYYFKPTLDVTVAYLYSYDNEVENNQSKYESTQRLSTTAQTFSIGCNVSF